jgi:hypothetical protein
MPPALTCRVQRLGRAAEVCRRGALPLSRKLLRLATRAASRAASRVTSRVARSEQACLRSLDAGGTMPKCVLVERSVHRERFVMHMWWVVRCMVLILLYVFCRCTSRCHLQACLRLHSSGCCLNLWSKSMAPSAHHTSACMSKLLKQARRLQSTGQSIIQS